MWVSMATVSFVPHLDFFFYPKCILFFMYFPYPFGKCRPSYAESKSQENLRLVLALNATILLLSEALRWQFTSVGIVVCAVEGLFRYTI